MIVTLLGIFPVSAYDFQVDGIYYNLNGEEVTVTNESGGPSNGSYSGDVVIPASVTYEGKTYPVTGIGNYTFCFCYDLISITIPESVTSIVGYNVFTRCSSLEEIIVSVDNPAYSSLEGVLYNKNQTELLKCPDSRLSITIPNSVTRIGDCAFSFCYELTSIIIPNSVTSIGYSAFSNCTGLTAITLPESLTSTGEGVFARCSGLTTIKLPESLTSIGSGAFSGCEGLTTITIPESVTSIGSGAFANCTGLTSITIPELVMSVDYGAFANCTSLTSVIWNARACSNGSYLFLSSWGDIVNNDTKITTFTFGNEVEQIPSGLCSELKGLTSITIPESVTSIGGGAFSGCTGLTSVTWNARACSSGGSLFNDSKSTITTFTFGDQVEQIPDSLCEGLSGLTTITLPESLTSIGESAFEGCTGLTTITLPESLTSIGNSAFEECSGLTTITLPESLTSIGDLAFRLCSGLTAITLPESLTSIGSGAFWSCTGLTSITIPESLTSIGYGAFTNCTSLTSVTWNARVCSSNGSYLFLNSWGDFVNNDTKITTFTFGNKVEQIPSGLCSELKGLTSITIPESVTSIVRGTFAGCTSLTSVAWNARACSSGGSLFNDSKSTITTFTFGDQVEQIPDSLCEGLSGLTTITLPESLTSIGESAFEGCTGLTTITLPESLTSIGNSAFEECSGLTTITLPESLTSIGDLAFRLCSGLTAITLPESLTSIGSGAFWSCTGLTSITIPESLTSIGYGAFTNCTSLTSVTWNARVCSSNGSYLFLNSWGDFVNNDTKITTFTFGNKVEQIPSGLCSELKGLTSITIPESVTSIVRGTFAGCTSLTSVAWNARACSSGGSIFSSNSTITTFTFGDQVEQIPDSLCEGLSGLTTITLPESVTSIGLRAFDNCSGLESIIWNARACSSISIPFGSDNTRITTFTFGDQVEQIPDSLCQGMSGLTTITIPESVTSIGLRAFDNCSGLESIIWNARACSSISIPFGSDNTRITTFTFGDQVEQIPDYLCQSMSGLTSITLPESLTSIGDCAFLLCSGLTSITFPESLTSIGDYAFSNCTNLTSMTIPNMVTSIGHCAFFGCNSLTSITIPDSVISIGDLAFFSCSSLTSMMISASVTSIGERAFSGCPNLEEIIVSADNPVYSSLDGVLYNKNQTELLKWPDKKWSVTIPESVTSIGYGAFSDCSGLTSVTIPESVMSIGKMAFLSCEGLTTITLPESLTSVDSYAFRLCSSLTSVTIPNLVATIGFGAFEDCSSLASVTIGESVTSIGDNAFAGCNRLESITIHAVIPPKIGSNTFDNYDMPLYVPAGCKSKYQEAEFWRNFTNIQETGVALYTVEAYSSDESMGTVVGGGEYEEGTLVTLAAVSFKGYHFVQWSDGNTENPRQITVTEDVSLMAEFSASGRLTVSTIDDAMGGVTAVLTAIPQEGYRFARWNDGNTENPRTVVVIGSIDLVAEFEAVATGVETQSTGVNIYVVNRTLHVENVEGDYRVYTTTGQLVYAGHAATVQLADAGVYVVRTSSLSQKVVVK